MANQLSFCEFAVKFKQKLNTTLDRINRAVSWQPIEELLSVVYSSERGRKSYPPLTIFKALLIQTWYNLSDYELEEALDDRLSFRRFVGLGVDQNTPDHSTFCNFRKQLLQYALTEKVFAEINRQLEKQGRIIKTGTLVDATLIEAAVKRPDQNDDGSAGRSDVDPEAEWVCKGKKRHFGYKAHVAVDEDSGLIRKAVFSGAKKHDGHVLETVLPADQDWVFADKAYESHANTRLVKERKSKNGIMRKACREYKLSNFQKLVNRIISKRRAKVEKTFAIFKRWYGYVKARYRGLARNSVQMFLVCIGFNLKACLRAT